MVQSNLPVRVRRTQLPARVRSWLDRRLPRAPVGRSLAQLARSCGLLPSSVLVAGPGAPPDAPLALVVHDAASPERRADFLAALRKRPTATVLALTPAELQLWWATSGGHRMRCAELAWGDELGLPALSPALSRMQALRRSCGLFLEDLPTAAAEARWEAFSALACAARDLLEELGPASRLPPRSSLDSGPRELLASTLGAFHVVLGAELPAEPGELAVPTPEPDAILSPLTEPLLADLARPLEDWLEALYLLPASVGTRLSWRLVAVVPDEAALHEAAGLRWRLHQHLAMLPDEVRRGASVGCEGPAVVTRAALHGALGTGLVRRPLQRTAARSRRQLLLGEDVLSETLAGPVLLEGALRQEAAQLIAATAEAWGRGSSVAGTLELLFGAWPVLLHLVRGGGVEDALEGIHEDLAGSSDPGLAAVGSAALSSSWGDPLAVDRGRPTELLRSLGPSLVRLQETCIEELD